jgi:PST family polysaccharide transporter
LLRWMLVKAPLLLGAYLAGLLWGLAGVCLAISTVELAVGVAYLLVPCRLIGVRVRDVFRRLGEILAAVLLMVAIVLVTRSLLQASLITLLVQIALGAGIYAVVILIVRRDLLAEALRLAGVQGSARVPSGASTPRR